MGYDSSRFTDLPVFLEEELTCTICYCILSKAVVTPCGHAFCRDCILTWFAQEKSCPVCRKNVHKICKPPVIVSNLLSRLKLVCAFKERGCTEILSLDQMDRHEATCRFRVKAGFFRSLIRNILPSFVTMMGSSSGRVHPDYDGEEVDDDMDMLRVRGRDVENVAPVPLVFAFAAAGMLYKSIHLLFND